MNEHMSMAELMATYEGTERISRGDVVKGQILSIGANEAIVNIGYMADGVLPKTEVSEEEWETLQVDDLVSVFIIKSDDGEGNVLLSLTKAHDIVVWDEFQSLFETQKAFVIKVKEAVKGGVVGVYKGARVFVPASQLALSFVETLTPYINQRLEVKVVEFDVDKKKIVASHKEVLKIEQSKKQADQISGLKEGDVLSGTVTKITKYGAFVNLGNTDGLIHISQLSWRRVKDPSEVVNIGDVVEVVVLSVDTEQNKIALKLSSVVEDPWETVSERYALEDVVEGVVTRTVPFGAFVEVEEGIEGLVHISELSEQRIQKATEVVKVGDVVKAMILSLDPAQRQMSLSIKEALAAEIDSYDPNVLSSEEAPAATLSDLFGDKLKGLKF